MGLTKPRASQIYNLDYKQAARAVTVSNVTLSGGTPAVVDGVTLALNDRVLVTGQTTGSYGAGISPGWSTNPKDYLNNTNGVNAVRGDYTIGLGFAVSGLSAGDIVNFQ